MRLRRTTRKKHRFLAYLILLISLAILIYAYFYITFWSRSWKWRFWVSGDLEDLAYLILFTTVWGYLINYIWKLEVRILLR